jgi:hypothetical protein
VIRVAVAAPYRGAQCRPTGPLQDWDQLFGDFRLVIIKATVRHAEMDGVRQAQPMAGRSLFCAPHVLKAPSVGCCLDPAPSPAVTDRHNLDINARRRKVSRNTTKPERLVIGVRSNDDKPLTMREVQTRERRRRQPHLRVSPGLCQR